MMSGPTLEANKSEPSGGASAKIGAVLPVGIRRGLIIGNSYAIALKDGLEDSDLSCRNDFSFLCAPGSELKIEVENGVIKPLSERAMVSTAQGLSNDAIRLKDYDLIVLAGLGVSASQCSRVYRSWRMAKHAESDRTALISRAALQAAVEGLLCQTISHRVAVQLRAWTETPIFVLPQPNPVQRLLTVERTTERLQETFEKWSLFSQDDVADDLYKIFIEAAEQAFNKVPAVFMEQPLTSRSGFFTRNEFQMKVRTSYDRNQQVENVVEDVTHMNADFGRLTIESLLAALSSANL